MACTDGRIRRVPSGVIAEANGPVEADPYYLYPLVVNDEPSEMWVLENVTARTRRIVPDWHTGYHKLLRQRSAAHRRQRIKLTVPWDKDTPEHYRRGWWKRPLPTDEVERAVSDGAPQSEYDWNAAHSDPSWP